MNRPRTGWIVSALFSLLALVTCGGDSPGDVHVGPPGDPAACVPGELTLPDGSCQPAGLPPDMPCPPGERALPTSADRSCQPAGVPPEACTAGRFLPDGRGGCEPILPEEACPPGQMAVPGERACREVAPCGEGPWGDIPVEATTEHVDQRYPGSDSDGSRERPWKTVQAGVRAASRGAIVAVAEGRYTEDVLIPGKQVRLWGRCPSRTEVVGLGTQVGAITLSGTGASGSEVRGLAATGAAAGIVVRGARSVVLEGVWIHEAEYLGLGIIGRAEVTVRGALVERNGFGGVFVSGSEAAIEATVVRGPPPNDAWEYARGIAVGADEDTGAGAKLSLTASLVEQNPDTGVFVSGSEAAIEATVVRATQPNSAGNYGRGIAAQANEDTGAGAKLSLTASLVEQNRGGGVFVSGSEAAIEATVVRATQPGDLGYGSGITVQVGPTMGARGELSLTASLVEENRGFGVTLLGVEATIEGTVVRATQPDVAGLRGQGIAVQTDPGTGAGAKLSLTASLVEQNRDIGLFVEGSEATVEATVVRATQPNAAGANGRGINVQATPEMTERGKLSLTASLVEQSHQIGLFIAGSEATIMATAVRDTKPGPAGLEFGDGIVVLDERGQSSATIIATTSTENARAGVLYVGSAGEISGVRSSANRFGVVSQPGTSGAQPTFGEGNAFEGNTEDDVVLGGDLAVPAAVSPLP